MNILVIDIGTTSTRGILYADGGRELAMHSVQTPLVIDSSTGFMEQSPTVYQQCTVQIVRAIAEQYPIDLISVTAFRSAPALVDREGNALCNFIMWQDTRNSEICKRLQPESELIYKKSGARLNTVFTASKLTWLRENAPDLWKKTYKAMIVPDYVICFMTGEFATDYTYGSRTHVMDIHTLKWDESMCRLFKLDRDKLCQLRPQGSVIGKVRSEFAALTGLRSGTPVISAGGDQQCGALGLGVLDSSTIEVNSGTGSFVISLVDRPVLENESVICNVAAVPHMYTQEMNIISSASAVNWLIREFFPEHWGDAPDFEAINALAAQTPAGAHGLFVVPHFQGCGSRDWNPLSRATFSGFSLGTKRSDLIRALYEGIAAEISKSIDVLAKHSCGSESLAVAGGLSRSDIYNRILCDMTDRSLRRSHNAQATARGAYLSAAVTSGLYESYAEGYAAITSGDDVDHYVPNPETARFYKDYNAKTEALYRAGLA